MWATTCMLLWTHPDSPATHELPIDDDHVADESVASLDESRRLEPPADDAPILEADEVLIVIGQQMGDGRLRRSRARRGQRDIHPVRLPVDDLALQIRASQLDALRGVGNRE